MKTLFSVNRAALLLERDRQTLVRALRQLPADGQERGQDRFKMATIVNALIDQETRTRSHQRRNDRAVSAGSSKLDELVAQFGEAVRTVERERTLKKRRALAVSQLAPLIDAYQIEHAEHERRLAGDEAERHWLRGQVIFSTMMEQAQAAGDWSRDQAWDALTPAMPYCFDGTE